LWWAAGSELNWAGPCLQAESRRAFSFLFFRRVDDDDMVSHYTTSGGNPSLPEPATAKKYPRRIWIVSFESICKHFIPVSYCDFGDTFRLFASPTNVQNACAAQQPGPTTTALKARIMKCEHMSMSYSASAAVASRAKQQQYEMRRVGFLEATWRRINESRMPRVTAYPQL
jgi:hypothetical protein